MASDFLTNWYANLPVFGTPQEMILEALIAESNRDKSQSPPTTEDEDTDD